METGSQVKERHHTSSLSQGGAVQHELTSDQRQERSGQDISNVPAIGKALSDHETN